MELEFARRYIKLQYDYLADEEKHSILNEPTFASFHYTVNWATLVLVEVLLSMLIMIAIPVFLLYKRARDEHISARTQEHARLRLVKWHMEDEIRLEMAKMRKLKRKNKKNRVRKGCSTISTMTTRDDVSAMRK